MRVYKEKHMTYGFVTKGEYMYKKGNKEGKAYSGPVVFWMGKVYGGTKMSRDVELEDELTVALDTDAPDEDNMKREYDKLKPRYTRYLEQPEHINFVPTKKQYTKGTCDRHFIKWEENIYEVDKKQYDKINGSSSVYKKAVYFVKLKWSLHAAGLDMNRRALADAEIKMEGIEKMLEATDLMKVQENLYTNGGEFHMGRGWNAGFTKVPDRREYVGFYHIHPEYGPMVGKYHGEQEHLTLQSIKQPGLNYDPKISVPDK